MIRSSAVGVFYKRTRWHSPGKIVEHLADPWIDSWMSEDVPNDIFGDGDPVLKITITVEVEE